MGWLTGWTYRKSHVINPATGAGTGYQVKITVHYGSGTDSGGDVYLNGKCRTDFGDIRFTKSDGITLLDYWMESKVDGDYAVFWVEVADDLSTNAVTIYIYYGKADATTTSNGDNTFLYFDDFEDDTVGQIPSGWTESENPDNGTTLTIASGYKGKGVELVCTTITYKGSRAISLSGSYAVEAWWKVPSGNGEFVLMGPNGYHLAVRRTSTSSYFQYLNATSGWVNTSLAVDRNWHKVKFLVREGSDLFDVYIDSVSYLNQTIYGTDTSSAEWGARFQETGTVDLDEMFARKYVSPEPTHGSWGSEEQLFIIKGYRTEGIDFKEAKFIPA